MTKSAEIWVVTKNCGLEMENICKNSNRVQESLLTCMYVCVPVCTSSFSYECAQLSAKKNIDVVEDELHHYRLDPHLHEGCCAAEAGGFNLFRPDKIADRVEGGKS